ncbi:MAG TPA: helix-turn-helix transcriptional regulator [Anaerolineaceae bacterium]|nr:helix-turn-helix transcriptional regulator [Anaerolineaceae bacterium]
MASEFGQYIDQKRRGRGVDGTDIMLKDIANTMGVTATYLSDIIKGRRNPPEMRLLEKIAEALHLDENERTELLDLAGRERAEAAPDLPEYIMDANLPHVRIALRRANSKNLGDDFWKKIVEEMDDKE